jgi:proteic killer suppression protein
MILSFKDDGTRDIFEATDSRQARQVCPTTLWRAARRKLQALNGASTLHALKEPPGNHLEKLAGDRAGQYSIRVNLQFRICFLWTGRDAAVVEITDYH